MAALKKLKDCVNFLSITDLILPTGRLCPSGYGYMLFCDKDDGGYIRIPLCLLSHLPEKLYIGDTCGVFCHLMNDSFLPRATTFSYFLDAIYTADITVFNYVKQVLKMYVNRSNVRFLAMPGCVFDQDTLKLESGLYAKMKVEDGVIDTTKFKVGFLNAVSEDKPYYNIFIERYVKNILPGSYSKNKTKIVEMLDSSELVNIRLGAIRSMYELEKAGIPDREVDSLIDTYRGIQELINNNTEQENGI